MVAPHESSVYARRPTEQPAEKSLPMIRHGRAPGTLVTCTLFRRDLQRRSKFPKPPPASRRGFSAERDSFRILRHLASSELLAGN